MAKHLATTLVKRTACAVCVLRLVLLVPALLAVGLAVSVTDIGAAPKASAAEVKVGALAPDLVFTTVGGVQGRLSQFRGKPVMLWLFTTWCDTCQAGLDAIASHLAEVNQTGLQVISLQLYNNLGYGGAPVAEFARAFASKGRSSPHWVWGEASQQGSYTYDPRGYPDVYFLISKDGVIRAVSSAPNVTMAQILAFARQAR